MAKPEWGTKQACPKCGTRFYDLGNAEPVVCISCANEWVPEPYLKSKQPMPFEAEKAAVPAIEGEDADLLVADDLDIDEEAEDSVADVSLDDDDSDIADVVDPNAEDE